MLPKCPCCESRPVTPGYFIEGEWLCACCWSWAVMIFKQYGEVLQCV